MATDYATIVVRRGNADAWENSQRPLASGEWGYDETSRVIKIGDGYTLWRDLASTITAGVSGQLPDDVRQALAANLANPETAEGAAVAASAGAGLPFDDVSGLYLGASENPIPSVDRDTNLFPPQVMESLDGRYPRNESRDSGSGVGIALGDGGVGPEALLVRSPETPERLLVVRDDLQVRRRFGVGSAPSSRTPFTAVTRVDGSTLSADAKAADKVGFSLNTSFVGGFSGEAGFGASNPSFLFGFNAFNIFGRGTSAGDLSGINTVYGSLLEAHVSSTDAALSTLNGVMVETSTNSSITEVRGINVVGHRPGTTPGSATVQTAVGVNIASPTMGTNRWALRTEGAAASSFGGDLHLSLDPATPRLLHAYSGEVRSKRASVGGSTVTTLGGVNVPSVGMLTVKSNADSDVVAALQGRGGQTGNILQMGRDTSIGARFDKFSRLIFQTGSALADADLVAGEGGMWVDNSNFGSERLNFRGKATNGTVRPTVSVPLNPITIAAAATDAASTQTLVNDLRQKLVNLGWFV